uniref:Transposase n=1 Tax=Cucumis melo TaxID=3656 RepID=A5Y732_CUCME|nr:transposase [Cucumis melo]
MRDRNPTKETYPYPLIRKKEFLSSEKQDKNISRCLDEVFSIAVACKKRDEDVGLHNILVREIVDVEEMVPVFLHVLVHNVNNRVIQRKFIRSSETVSRHFNLVLLAVIRLHDKWLKKPQPVTNTYIDPRWKCFKNCLGALDGTYIKMVGKDPRLIYAFFGMCLHDQTNFKFPRVFTISTPPTTFKNLYVTVYNPLSYVTWFYYLCNARYPNTKRFLAPYIGQRKITNVDDLEDIDEGDLACRSMCGQGEDEATLVECLVELVSAMDESRTMGCSDQTHPAAKGLLNKLFPYYDELVYVFERDRVTGQGVKTFVNVESNDPIEYEGFQTPDENDMKNPTMYSQGFNMS